MVCMGFLVLFALSPWFQQFEAMPRDRLILQVLGAALGVVGALAAIVIWFGMVTFCLREDRSPIGTKIFWFILFFATGWFGAAAYFFIVYSSQVPGGRAAGTLNAK
jgi:hypothetical protein